MAAEIVASLNCSQLKSRGLVPQLLAEVLALGVLHLYRAEG